MPIVVIKMEQNIFTELHHQYLLNEQMNANSNKISIVVVIELLMSFNLGQSCGRIFGLIGVRYVGLSIQGLRLIGLVDAIWGYSRLTDCIDLAIDHTLPHCAFYVS